MNLTVTKVGTKTKCIPDLNSGADTLSCHLQSNATVRCEPQPSSIAFIFKGEASVLALRLYGGITQKWNPDVRLKENCPFCIICIPCSYVTNP